MYALGTFLQAGGRKFTGLVMQDRVTPLVALARLGAGADPHAEHSLAALLDSSLLELLENWEHNLKTIDRLAAKAASDPGLAWLPVSSLRVHPPVDLPRQIFCTGANYRKHVVDMTIDSNVGPEGLSGAALRRWAEDMMDERAARGEPYVFTKPVSAVAGAFDPLSLPANTAKPDWELELGVVIGKGGYRIGREDALSHVAGYAIVNDISARDLIPRTDYKMLGTDWLRSKGQVGFLPFGPYLVPSRFVADPQDLRLRLTVSGKVMQDETTADMLFDIARQIEYISSYCRLLPGDLICTGSPAGNGTHYNRFLQPGDVMEGTIDGLGTQRASCVAGDA
jgi:2-keto-4-pentenoate hydratase/2-oxohepta-3-ene-1,7-dioic acid hydratase in catechol pathway